MRAWLNRCRRWLWRQLFFRMVFGEQWRGRALPHTRIAPSTCIDGEHGLVLQDHVFIGQFNYLEASAGLHIGEGVQITNYVSILTHSSHRSIRLLGRRFVHTTGEIPGYVRAPVHIGAYSFIGPHSVIEAGCHIGKGVVVCSHSRVRGVVPDFAIVAGTPAQTIGDVRQRDAQLLAQFPDLAPHYAAWADEHAPQEFAHG